MRSIGALATAALATILTSACSMAGPSPDVAPPASIRTPLPWTAADGPRPILVDTDLDADDLVAIAILAGDPAVEIQAVTISGTGIVHCGPGVDIARRWLALFELEAVPVACGRDDPGPSGRAFPAEWRAGADAGFGLDLPAVGGPRETTTAAELIDRAAAGADGRLLIVAIGPWTNLADAIRDDPVTARAIGGIHAMLGAIDVPGNVQIGGTTVEDGVEWNARADPDAVAAVLRSEVPVTLVPLDATNHVPVTPDLIDPLASVGAGTGADLVSQLYLRNPSITSSGQSLWDSLAALLVSGPAYATWADVRVTVTASGDGAGRLVRSDAGRPLRAALSADGPRATDAWLAALTRTKVTITPDGRPAP